MIGIYNYTVWLTYMSFLSAGFGIILTEITGKPFVGIICLMFSGLCDAFDGKVASTKKNRTSFDKKYGIQIDSLSDVVAFGILPAVIGIEIFKKVELGDGTVDFSLTTVLSILVFAIYILAAKVRLAYFNVTEDERQQVETGARAHYTGLPVTAAALVFPAVYAFKAVSDEVLLVAYFAVMFLTACAFVLKFKVKKPGLKGVIMWTIIGLVEFTIVFAFLGGIK